MGAPNDDVELDIDAILILEQLTALAFAGLMLSAALMFARAG